MKHYIEGVTLDHAKIAELLQSALFMHRHTAVLMMTRQAPVGSADDSMASVEFKWHHPTIRPWGNEVPRQCPECGRLGFMKFNQDRHIINIQCKADDCSFSMSYVRARDTDSVKVGNLGEWMVAAI